MRFTPRPGVPLVKFNVLETGQTEVTILFKSTKKAINYGRKIARKTPKGVVRLGI